MGRKRKESSALNPKRSKNFSAKSNCGTASKGEKNVLDNYEQHKKRMEEVRLADNAEKIIKVYQKLGKGVD
jgi:hypothetical protein